jgi:hypothetical protein
MEVNNASVASADCGEGAAAADAADALALALELDELDAEGGASQAINARNFSTVGHCMSGRMCRWARCSAVNTGADAAAADEDLERRRSSAIVASLLESEDCTVRRLCSSVEGQISGTPEVRRSKGAGLGHAEVEAETQLQAGARGEAQATGDADKRISRADWRESSRNVRREEHTRTLRPAKSRLRCLAVLS